MNFLESLADYYNSEAEKFHGTRQRHRPEFDVLVEEITKRFDGKKKLRVLELGCGSGRLYGYLSKALPNISFDYTGIDISAKLVEIAKKEHPDANRKVANMTEFLQKVKNQETYDIIIAIASFHHLPSYRVRITTANHMYRALAYEGMCFMTNRSDSQRFRERFRGSILVARLKTIFSLGVYRARDLFLPRRSDARHKVYYRYYHIFTLPELEKIGKTAGFGAIDQFYLTAEGERTPLKKKSRNSCSVRGKSVFLG